MRNEIYNFIKSNSDKDVIIVIAPTGSGKTTSAIKHAVLSNEKIILMTPTKATTFEFYNKLLEEVKKVGNKRVIRDDSDVKLHENISIKDWLISDIIVTTYERAVNVFTKHATDIVEAAKSEGRNIRLIIDEFHNITNEDRTFAIQTLLGISNKYDIKLMLLSATFPEINEIIEKFEKLGRTTAVFRKNEGIHELKVETLPVSTYCEDSVIKEGCYCDGCFTIAKGMGARYYARIYRKILEERGSERYVVPPSTKTVIEYVLNQPKPILIFIPNRRLCEEVARFLSKRGVNAVPFHSGIDYPIRATIQKYFNALVKNDMISAKRYFEIIVQYFKFLNRNSGKIDVIVATHTLSQGVNIPVETVVMPYLHMIGKGSVTPEKPTMIAQMAGRAGRFSGKGKAIIVYDPFIHKTTFIMGKGVKLENIFTNEKELVKRALGGKYEHVVVPNPKFSIALYLIANIVFNGIEEMRKYWYPDDERFEEIKEMMKIARKYVMAIPLLDYDDRPNDLANELVGVIDTDMIDYTFIALTSLGPRGDIMEDAMWMADIAKYRNNQNVHDVIVDVSARKLISIAYFMQEEFISYMRYILGTENLNVYNQLLSDLINDVDAKYYKNNLGPTYDLVRYFMPIKQLEFPIGFFGYVIRKFREIIPESVKREIYEGLSDEQLTYEEKIVRAFMLTYALKGNATIASTVYRYVSVLHTMTSWALKNIAAGERVESNDLAYLDEDAEWAKLVMDIINAARKYAFRLYKGVKGSFAERVFALLSPLS